MKTIKARYNCGRWIWDCSVCNSGNLISPGDEMAYCGGCYAGKMSKYEEVREKTKQEAWANGDVYKIAFPKNHEEIEMFLASRNKTDRSWAVGETIGDLELENEQHPVLRYLRNKPKAKKKQEPLSVKDAVRVK